MPCILVTKKCNLNCSYCQFEKKDIVLTDSAFIKFLDFIDKIILSKSILTLVYTGGEPLMYPKKVLRFADIVAKRYPGGNAKQIVGTNLTIYNEDVFSDKRLHFAVSIDGTKSSHNVYRSFRNGNPTYNIVIDNLRKLAGFKNNIAVKYTFNPNNVHTDFIEFLKETIHINPDVSWNFSIAAADGTLNSKNFKRVFDEKLRTAEFLISEAKNGNIIKVDFFNNAIKSRYNLKNNIDSKGCGYATGLIMLSPEGDIFPCAGALINNSPKIGNVNSSKGLIESFQRIMLREVISQIKDEQTGCVNNPFSELAKCNCKEQRKLSEIITERIIKLLEKNLNEEELMGLYEKTQNKAK
jgi:uncharacterized protein